LGVLISPATLCATLRDDEAHDSRVVICAAKRTHLADLIRIWGKPLRLIFSQSGNCRASRSLPPYEKEKEKQTVLIVDDEPIIRLLVRQILEDAGHEVKEASNADDALRLIADDGITVVLTDMDMPGSMDGLALVRNVAGRWPNIGVVVTSGRRLPRPDEMPRETRFLSKPFSEERLIGVVGDACPH
jgi:CheY-like chemotaxis protein